MRKGFNGLEGLVRERLAGDPTSGHIFLFANARRDRLKLIFFRWFRVMGLRQAHGRGTA